MYSKEKNFIKELKYIKSSIFLTLFQNGIAALKCQEDVIYQGFLSRRI